MENHMNIKHLTDLCKNRTVWIQTHNYPDPDAISSAFALKELLSHFNIETKLCYEGAIDKLSSTKMLDLLQIEIHPHQEIADMLTPSDMIILVDCQKNSGNTTDFTGDELAVIDHHPQNFRAEYQYCDIRSTGACASIIASYFREAGITPSENAATAMLYGIRMDTLQFSRGVTAFDVEMFGYLFPFVNQTMMQQLETNNMEFTDLQAYGMSIKNTSIYGKVGFSYVDFNCPDALVAILSDFLLSLVEVEIAVIYAKRDDGYKFSIRSERTDANAGQIASLGLSKWGSGGGHTFMAGGFVPKENVTVSNEVFYEEIRSHFIAVLKELCPRAL